MVENLKDFIQDKKALDILLARDNKVFMVIGGADTGKTTFVEHLARHLAKNNTVAVADLDMGQSHIGPPTTIAWGMVDHKFSDWELVAPKMIYFVGTLSPMGNLLPTVSGAKIIVEDALKTCQKVVIDTTGLVNEPIGRVLKQNKIDLIQPDVVIALEEARELENILGCYRGLNKPRIIDVTIPKTIDKKNVAKRAEFRLLKLKKYFANSKLYEFSLQKVMLRFTGTDYTSGSLDLKDRVVSFRDKENRDIAIGVVERIDLRQNRIFVYSPYEKTQDVEYIIAGAVSHPLKISLL